jgi:hypothetical protein
MFTCSHHQHTKIANIRSLILLVVTLAQISTPCQGVGAAVLAGSPPEAAVGSGHGACPTASPETTGRDTTIGVVAPAALVAPLLSL